MMNRRFYAVIRGRKRYFATREAALAFASYVFQRYGIVLGVMEAH